MGLISISTIRNISETAISNLFIDSYFGKANPAFIVVYLYFHRHFQSGTATLDIKDVADRLDLLESDVVNGLKYWQKQKLLVFNKSADDYTIDFLPIPNKNNTLKVVKKTETKKASPTKALGKQSGSEKQNTVKPEALENKLPHNPEPSEVSVTVERQPVYTPEEIEIYQKESAEIKNLFAVAEKALGKLLSSNDLSTIFSFYDWLRLPVDVISILLNYCAEHEHRSIRYIEKVAVDWSENDIQTVSQANEYIQIFNVSYRQILKALGRGSKDPTPAEIKFMDKWLHEYKMPLNIILEACDLTVLTADKPRIQYTDKIITNWYENGVKTAEDSKKAAEEYQKQSSKNVGGMKTKNDAKPNRFVNFTQREWNFDSEEMQKLKWKYLEETE